MHPFSILLLAVGLFSLYCAATPSRFAGYDAAQDRLSRWGALADGIGFISWAFAFAYAPRHVLFVLPGALLLMFGAYVNLKPTLLRWARARR